VFVVELVKLKVIFVPALFRTNDAPKLVFEVKNLTKTTMTISKKAIARTLKIVFLFVFKIENILVYFLINCNNTSS
jgi:hypothetical protein